MSTYNEFEDLDSWKKARVLSQKVYKMTNKGSFHKDYKLRAQINDACDSITSNIAEGFERDGTKEQIYFMSIAKGSVAEVRSQLYTALDREYINNKEFEECRNLAREVGKLIGGFIRYLKNCGTTGRKYKKEKNMD